MSGVEIRFGERTVLAEVARDGSVRIDGLALQVMTMGDGLYRVADDSRHWNVAVAGPADNRWVFVDGHVMQVEVVPAPQSDIAGKPGPRARGGLGDHELSSPMPASVTRVLVEPGAQVSSGQPLLMLEAMKMELAVRAPRDGVVKAIHCRAGDLVQPGVNLVDLE